jgi:mRNA interferase YafQ
MRELVLTPKFQRAFRKFAKRNPELQQRIEETLLQMQSDVFTPELETHKLGGKLTGSRACSCGYDCRIVFSIEKIENADTDLEAIILLDVGTHDHVY